MRNLTSNQWLAIIVGFLGVLGASTTQLDTLFGHGVTTLIQAVNYILMSTMSVVVAVTSGQSNLVRAVQGMPGVERIQVNEKASQVLAGLAMDPAQDKIEPVANAEKIIQKTAEGK